MTASASKDVVAEGVLIRVEPRSYLSWPRVGGKTYDEGQLLRVPPEWAAFYCRKEPIGGRAIASVVDEASLDRAPAPTPEKK